MAEQAPAGEKALAGAAGACTLFLGARFVEYLVYETKEDAFGKGPIARVLDFFSSFIGQVKSSRALSLSLSLSVCLSVSLFLHMFVRGDSEIADGKRTSEPDNRSAAGTGRTSEGTVADLRHPVLWLPFQGAVGAEIRPMQGAKSLVLASCSL